MVKTASAVFHSQTICVEKCHEYVYPYHIFVIHNYDLVYTAVDISLLHLFLQSELKCSSISLKLLDYKSYWIEE